MKNCAFFLLILLINTIFSCIKSYGQINKISDILGKYEVTKIVEYSNNFIIKEVKMPVERGGIILSSTITIVAEKNSAFSMKLDQLQNNKSQLSFSYGDVVMHKALKGYDIYLGDRRIGFIRGVDLTIDMSKEGGTVKRVITYCTKTP